MTRSFYWYDYETTGIHPAADRVVQFAGIRTDLNFNIIGEPDMLYCKLADDVLPHPDACLVTGITPQLANAKGLSENQFTAYIAQRFNEPGTCVVGYNNIRFDDEFTRHLLYRNFYDPYGWSYLNNNSRWDVLDVMRLAYALRPEGIKWPTSEEGVVSFKLENLTKANGLLHEAAHDALSDVRATIAVAKQLKEQQPKLFQWAFDLRIKENVFKLLNLHERPLAVHVSGRVSAKRKCLSVIVPIAMHSANKNAVIVCDVTRDIEPLLQLTAEEIHQKLYTTTDDLAEGEERIPLKLVHANKSPMIAPMNTLSTDLIDELSIDIALCNQRRETLIKFGIESKLQTVFEMSDFETSVDPDFMLYSGGFFSYNDKAKMKEIISMAPSELSKATFLFEDPRLDEMLFRYRCRNQTSDIGPEEKQRWQEFRQSRLLGESQEKVLGLLSYFERLDELVSETHDEKNQNVLEQLIQYGETIQESISH